MNRYTLDEMEDKANALKSNVKPLKQEPNISINEDEVKMKTEKSPMKLRGKRSRKDLGDDFLLNF